jgi:hypothetical protein
MKKVLIVAAFAAVTVGFAAYPASGQLLVWVACKGSEGGLDNVLALLEERGIGFEKTDVKEAADLQAILQRTQASIFFIPDSTGCSYDEYFNIGQRFSRVLRGFVEEGKHIVLMKGISYSQNLMLGAGLVEESIIRGRTPECDPTMPVCPKLEVVRPEHPLAQSVPAIFQGQPTTFSFERESVEADGGEIIIQVQHTERAVVFVKKFGEGALIFLGFGLDSRSDPLDKIVINSLAPGVSCKGSIDLKPNEFMTGQKIGGKALTETKEKQYCIPVAAGAKLFAVKLESKGNLDLHIRQGKPVERSGQAIIADYSLPSPDGNEFLLIFAPQLKAGPYFIAVENKEDSEQEFTIIATPIFDIQELKGSAEGSVAPNAGLIPFLRQYLATQGGMLGLTQYKFDVPGGAKSVTIRLEGPADRTLNLHLRHDKPVEIVKDQVAADLSVIGPGGQKGVVLAGTLLKAGRWYIAVESLQPNEKVDYRVVVEIETGTQKIMMVLEREPKK